MNFLEFYNQQIDDLEIKLNQAFKDADIVKMNYYNGQVEMLNKVFELVYEKK